MPVKAFHGENDTTVEFINSKLMVDSVNRYGGKAELVTLCNMEHNDAIDYAYRSTELLDWLLTQQKTDFSRVAEPCEEWY